MVTKMVEQGVDNTVDSSPSLPPAQTAPNLVHPFQFGWSLDNGFCGAEVASGDGPVPLPAEIGEETLTAWAMEPGFEMFDFGFKLRQRINITATKVTQPGTLFIRAGLTSAGQFRHNRHGAFTEGAGQYSLHLCCNQGGACTFTFDPDEPAFCLAPIITEDRLRLMLVGRKVPTRIERFLDGRGDDFIADPRASLTMSRLAHEVRHNPYRDGMSDLFIQGKVHEMLAEAFKDLDEGGADEGRIYGPDHRRAMMVRDLLMADPINPPSMEALSLMVDLSQRRLNLAFQDAFGATVFEWLVEQRLLLARDLLLRGDLSIKEVAYRLGYARINTFTSAFTRRFGISPARYRLDCV